MIATLVYVDVLPEHVEAFKKITEYNHVNTRKEERNVRFDVLQSNEDPTQFVLYEVFEDEDAVAFHKTTEHYNKWREEVEPYMYSKRRATKTTPLCFD